MVFDLISAEGDGDSLAWRLQQEGQEVRLDIREAWMEGNLKGMVPHSHATPKRGDIAVYDSSKLGDEAAALHAQGIPVLFASPLADRLEMDRWWAMQMFQRLGMKIRETEHFTHYEKARAFLRKHEDQNWVFKPGGNQDAAFTYVPENTKDLYRMLDYFEKAVKGPVDFILQEFCHGVVIEIEGWFNGEDWIDGSWNATLEHKYFLVGDKGSQTGCAHATVYAYEDEPKLTKRHHRKLTEMLRKDGYRGPFCLNLVIHDDDVWVLEATPRAGYEGIQPFVELWDAAMSAIFQSLALGHLEHLPVDISLMAAAVRLSIPPYPHSGEKHRSTGGLPVQIEEGDWRWFWPSGIQYDEEEDEYETAPTDGVIGAMCAVGSSYDRCMEEMGARLDRVIIPNLQYRTDFGCGDAEAWGKLDRWGYDVPPVAQKLLEHAPPPLDDQHRIGIGGHPLTLGMRREGYGVSSNL